MAEILKGIHRERFMVWAEDLIILGNTQADMVDNFAQVLETLPRRSLHLAAHKSRFFASQCSGVTGSTVAKE